MAETLNLTFDLEEWPWHYNVTTKTCGFMRYTCTPIIKQLSLLDQNLWLKLYIWLLTLKNDLDLLMVPLKMCSLVRFTCTPNIKCLSLLDQMLWPMWPIFWHVTLKDDLNILPLKMCGFMKYTQTIKSLSVMAQKLWPMLKVVWPKLYIWPLTLKNDLDLIIIPLKMCSLVRCTYTPNIKCLSLLDQMLWPKWKWTFGPILYLTFDLEGWPWSWQITLKMCCVSRCMCMQNIKFQSVLAQKLWPVLKLFSNKQTDKQTGQKHYVPKSYIGD